MEKSRIHSLIPIVLSYLIVNVGSSPVADVSTSKSTPCTSDALSTNIHAVFSPSKSIHNSNNLQNVVVHGMTCQCDLDIPEANRRDDYQYTPGIGIHKFHTRGANFNDARKICNQEGGHLAIVDSDAEERILLELFKRAGPLKNVANGKQAYIGIHNLFSNDDWVTIFNEPLHTRGYTKWSDDDGYGGQPDNLGGNQHCGSLWKPGVATGMDDVDCSLKYAFFCEIPEVRIVN